MSAPLNQLTLLRDQLVLERRLSAERATGHNSAAELAEFSRLQSSIEIVDRAIADEARLSHDRAAAELSDAAQGTEKLTRVEQLARERRDAPPRPGF